MMKLLVIDDDTFVREMLAHILGTAGYAVETAENGSSGIEHYRASPDTDLIISDMNMPVMNGIEFIREMRSSGARVPIIILTANNEINIAIEAINAGASDYQYKDENIQDTILISVAKCLEKYQIERQNLLLMERLNDALAHMNAIMDNMADGLLVTDNNCRIVRTNPALLSMFKVEAPDLSGCQGGEIGSADLRSIIENSCRLPREPFSSELSLAGGKVGKAVSTPISAASAEGAAPEAIGSVIIIRDITSDKEIDRMKTDFVSTVSHELRTPLTSIMGFARLVKKKLEEVIFPLLEPGDKKIDRTVKQVGENIGIITAEGERLMSLINNVLDIAKMEAGKVEWREEPFAVKDLISRATAATTPLFEQKNLHLAMELDPDLPELRGDFDRLIQVLINLLSNAVKFTDAGSVICRARQKGGEVLISVTDSGIGIAEADLVKVFEKFKQVGDTMTSKPRGTGLGLPICREIVEHHQGRIWAESDPGRGSTFLFTLPIS